MRREPTPDDATLLSQIAAGDLSGFDEFVNRYAPRLFRFVRSRLADEQRAEDTVQDVFLRIFRGAEARRSAEAIPNGSAATWLFTIAANCVKNQFRVLHRRPWELHGDITTVSDAQPCTNTGGGADPVQAAEGTDLIQQLLKQLPEEQREVVTLKFFAELTFAEIAEVLNCPLGTVKSRMRYALEKLHVLLSPTERAMP